MRSVISALAWLLVASTVSEAQAQLVTREEFTEFGEPELSRVGHLEARSAMAVGRKLLLSAEPADRRRGARRLAGTGTPEALEILVEALGPGSAVTQRPEDRLLVVRLLGPFANQEDVREALGRELLDARRSEDSLSLLPMVRASAALALAADGADESLRLLIGAATRPGPASEAARAALLAHPPVRISAILNESPLSADDEVLSIEADPFPGSRKPGKKPPPPNPRPAPKKPEKPTPRILTPPLMTLLGALGDVRALGALRAELASGHRPSRVAAARALLELGDLTLGERLLPWLKDSDPRIVQTAAELLVSLGHPQAKAGVLAAFAAADAPGAAVKLAHDLADPGLASELQKRLPDLTGDDRLRATMALGRLGRCGEVVKLLADKHAHVAATVALSRCPGAEAETHFQQGLANKRSRLTFARAAVMRELSGMPVSDLAEHLSEFAKSSVPAERELAAFGQTALGYRELADVVGTGKDLATVSGAARASLLREEGELSPLLPLIASVDPEAPSTIAQAAGIALRSAAVADQVEFSKLLRLAERGGPLAPLAARALPRRDDGTHTMRLRELLAGSDPIVRAAIASGMAEAKAPETASLLGERYELEQDARVRRAIVGALGQRSEVVRIAVLEMASRFDADLEVRSLASQALSTRLQVSRPLAGRSATMTHVAFAPRVAPPVLRLVLPNGTAVPVVPSPDGTLIVGGLPDAASALDFGP